MPLWQAGGVTVPPSPPRDRDLGDAWVEAPDGARFWGRFGAAGLIAHDPQRGVLLQHRAGWSHHGGTWGIPGGARHHGEEAVAGALRESREEAGVPGDALRPHALHVLDLGVWTYTTMIATVERTFEPVAGDAESLELAWVAVDEVERRDLHPGFAASWPVLRAAIAVRPAVVVDAANVVGSVPDGWWRDRAGAAQRLVSRIAGLAAAGVESHHLGLDLARWYPAVSVVLEGRARGAAAQDGVRVVDAPGDGDDAIVAEARRRHEAGERVTVVTSDRGLRSRVEGFADTRGAGWLTRLLPGAPAPRP